MTTLQSDPRCSSVSGLIGGVTNVSKLISGVAIVSTLTDGVTGSELISGIDTKGELVGGYTTVYSWVVLQYQCECVGRWRYHCE